MMPPRAPPPRLPALTDRLDAARHGQKALRLSQAAQMGLPVPAGVVIPAPLLRGHSWEPESAPLGRGADAASRAALCLAVQAALADLGPGPYILRSSALDEDRPGASAAGLYRSEPHLHTVEAILAAVDRCLQAAQSAPVATYRALHETAAGPDSIALILQRQVTPRWAGVLLTRGAHPAWRLAELAPRRIDGVTAPVDEPLRCLWPAGARPTPFPPGPTGGAATAPDVESMACQAEALLGAPADVEWALDEGGTLWLLQIRPAPALAAGSSDPIPWADHCWADGTWWQQDREHNPDPLSRLHADLVAHLDRTCTLPIRMRVLGGRLHTAPRTLSPEAQSRLAAEATRCLRDPDGWWQHQAEPALQQAIEVLARCEATGKSLAECLEAFDAFYQHYAGEVSPVLAAAQSRCRDAMHTPYRSAAVHTPLATAVQELAEVARATGASLTPWLSAGELPPATIPGAAAYRKAATSWLSRVGGLFPVWDLAAPPLQETPGVLYRAVALELERGRRASRRPATPDAPPLSPSKADSPPDSARPPEKPPRTHGASRSPCRDVAIRLRALREQDDLLFGRALALLRRAVLRAGTPALRLAGREAEPDRLFALDLHELQALEAYPAAVRQVLGAPAPNPASPSAASFDPMFRHAWEPRLRGTGIGQGPVSGRARVARSMSELSALLPRMDRGDILVCPTLLPSSVPYLVGARGVVTDHGGGLSHAALLATELDIPAVLGTREATARIATADRLVLQPEQGIVILETPAPPRPPGTG